MESFRIERCIKPSNFGHIQSAQLHHFCDASEKGYGVVTYLKLISEGNDVHAAFIMGKARVAPLKQMIIPRMELTTALLAVRMDKMLSTELQIALDKPVFWTDSTSVLKYIKNETQRFQMFVTNRVSAIREASCATQWRYINTKLNLADHASRGLKADGFLKCSNWIQGPSFLKQSELE